MLKEIHEQADAVAETIGERAARGIGIDLGDLGERIDDELLRTRPADRDRRLRHLVPRRADRPLRDRGVGARAGRGRDRLRVPLPQPGRRPRRPRDRDLAVRRDRRHAGGDADGARARRRRCSRSRTSWARRRRARPTASCTRARASRSASRRRRRSSARWRRCTCWRCGSPSCAGRSSQSELKATIAELKRLPHRIARAARARPGRRSSGSPSEHHDADFFLYLGRHAGLPAALEGALKLKEISYIATDAYAAGEMKHGPIALLDESTPGGRRRDRLAGAREGDLEHPGGRARGARVIAVASEGNERDRRARRRGDRGAAAPTGCSRRCWR